MYSRYRPHCGNTTGPLKHRELQGRAPVHQHLLNIYVKLLGKMKKQFIAQCLQ